MKIAAIGDIHGNITALNACLNRAERENVSLFLFTGDYISDCACPAEVMNRLLDFRKDHDCLFVRGNREQYMLDHRAHPDTDNWQWGTAGGSLLFTCASLTEEHWAFIEALPLFQVVQPDKTAPALLFCHGEPHKMRARPMQTPSLIEEHLDALNAGVYICGHTHEPGAIHLPNNRLAVNTGCCGTPESTPGRAQFVLLESTDGLWRETPVQEPYDVDAVIASFREKDFFTVAGLWAAAVAHGLRHGGHPALDLFNEGMALAASRGIEGDMTRVPESVWRETAEKLGIL